MDELTFYLSDQPIAPYSDDFDNIMTPRYKFATDASILYIFEGYWAENSSWMEVLARDMPS